MRQVRLRRHLHVLLVPVNVAVDLGLNAAQTLAARRRRGGRRASSAGAAVLAHPSVRGRRELHDTNARTIRGARRVAGQRRHPAERTNGLHEAVESPGVRSVRTEQRSTAINGKDNVHVGTHRARGGQARACLVVPEASRVALRALARRRQVSARRRLAEVASAVAAGLAVAVGSARGSVDGVRRRAAVLRGAVRLHALRRRNVDLVLAAWVGAARTSVVLVLRTVVLDTHTTNPLTGVGSSTRSLVQRRAEVGAAVRRRRRGVPLARLAARLARGLVLEKARTFVASRRSPVTLRLRRALELRGEKALRLGTGRRCAVEVARRVQQTGGLSQGGANVVLHTDRRVKVGVPLTALLGVALSLHERSFAELQLARRRNGRGVPLADVVRVGKARGRVGVLADLAVALVLAGVPGAPRVIVTARLVTAVVAVGGLARAANAASHNVRAAGDHGTDKPAVGAPVQGAVDVRHRKAVHGRARVLAVCVVARGEPRRLPLAVSVGVALVLCTPRRARQVGQVRHRHNNLSELRRRVAQRRQHLGGDFVHLQAHEMLVVGLRHKGLQLLPCVHVVLRVVREAPHHDTEHSHAVRDQLLVRSVQPRAVHVLVQVVLPCRAVTLVHGARASVNVRQSTVSNNDDDVTPPGRRVDGVEGVLGNVLQCGVEVRPPVLVVVALPVEVSVQLVQVAGKMSGGADAHRARRLSGTVLVRTRLRLRELDERDTESGTLRHSAALDRVRVARQGDCGHPVLQNGNQPVESVRVRAKRTLHTTRAVDHESDVQVGAGGVADLHARLKVVVPLALRVLVARARSDQFPAVQRLAQRTPVRPRGRQVPHALVARNASVLSEKTALRDGATGRLLLRVPLAEVVLGTVPLRDERDARLRLARRGRTVPRAALLHVHLTRHLTRVLAQLLTAEDHSVGGRRARRGGAHPVAEWISSASGVGDVLALLRVARDRVGRREHARAHLAEVRVASSLHNVAVRRRHGDLNGLARHEVVHVKANVLRARAERPERVPQAACLQLAVSLGQQRAVRRVFVALAAAPHAHVGLARGLVAVLHADVSVAVVLVVDVPVAELVGLARRLVAVHRAAVARSQRLARTVPEAVLLLRPTLALVRDLLAAETLTLVRRRHACVPVARVECVLGTRSLGLVVRLAVSRLALRRAVRRVPVTRRVSQTRRRVVVGVAARLLTNTPPLALRRPTARASGQCAHARGAVVETAARRLQRHVAGHVVLRDAKLTDATVLTDVVGHAGVVVLEVAQVRRTVRHGNVVLTRRNARRRRRAVRATLVRLSGRPQVRRDSGTLVALGASTRVRRLRDGEADIAGRTGGSVDRQVVGVGATLGSGHPLPLLLRAHVSTTQVGVAVPAGRRNLRLDEQPLRVAIDGGKVADETEHVVALCGTQRLRFAPRGDPPLRQRLHLVVVSSLAGVLGRTDRPCDGTRGRRPGSRLELGAGQRLGVGLNALRARQGQRRRAAVVGRGDAQARAARAPQRVVVVVTALLDDHGGAVHQRVCGAQTRVVEVVGVHVAGRRHRDAVFKLHEGVDALEQRQRQDQPLLGLCHRVAVRTTVLSWTTRDGLKRPCGLSLNSHTQ
eukprot:Rhum_TRINITY_DN13226_c0_g1::Rhum_TRINITY_DN13226_c0_g1_i1::g.57920::m.57920